VPAGFLRFSRLAVSLAGYSTQNVALALTDLAAQPAALSSAPHAPPGTEPTACWVAALRLVRLACLRLAARLR
jgi:hypothetical protein